MLPVLRGILSNRHRGRGRGHALPLLLLSLTLLLSGCEAPPPGTTIVLTTGFARDEVLRIGGTTCLWPEAVVYLMSLKSSYETALGGEIWEVTAGGVSMEERIKDVCLSELSQVKLMQLLAQEQDVSLDADEAAAADRAAQEYLLLLNDRDVTVEGLTPELARTMTRELMLSRKLYTYLIRDINPEISDDEARRITVERIVYETRTEALSALGLIRNGAEFEELMAEAPDGSAGTISFGKGETEAAVEEVTFQLNQNEISGVVETAAGYCLYKCVSTFNREETEANKVRIVKERRRAAFSEQYEAFAAQQTRIVNDELWNSISLAILPQGMDVSFFSVVPEE